MMVYVFSIILDVVIVAAVVLFLILDFRPTIKRHILARVYILSPIVFIGLAICAILHCPPEPNDDIMLVLSLSVIVGIIASIYYSYKGIKTYGGLKGCKTGLDKWLYINNIIILFPLWLIAVIIMLFSGDLDAIGQGLEIVSDRVNEMQEKE